MNKIIIKLWLQNYAFLHFDEDVLAPRLDVKFVALNFLFYASFFLRIDAFDPCQNHRSYKPILIKPNDVKS